MQKSAVCQGHCSGPAVCGFWEAEMGESEAAPIPCTLCPLCLPEGSLPACCSLHSPAPGSLSPGSSGRGGPGSRRD